ncbi:MAG TPA: SBBP repeat-containing protein [Terriglobia bacterium]|nr:SBBP repeat-containing protein [Terriglobia bacterium]
MSRSRRLLFIRCAGFALLLGAGAILRWPALAPPQIVAAHRWPQDQPSRRLARLPLVFEENRGQTDPAVRFLARRPGYACYFTASEVVLSLRQPERTTDLLRVKLAGANPHTAPEGMEALPGTVNYLLGNDPAQWRSGVATYAKVQYRNVYPGIDVVFYGNPQELEFDFLVAPGASPDNIQLDFAGADSLRLDASGDLIVTVSGHPLRMRRPSVYQERDRRRQPISGRFAQRSPQRVAFEVASYDPTLPLVIDPVLSYATYLGRSGWDEIRAIGVDAAGNVYATGFTTSTDFPLQTPLRSAKSAFEDIFISKLSADGSQLLYSTYLGGNDTDFANALAVSPAGVVTVAGYTYSTNFPVASPFQANKAGTATRDGFVARLNESGTALLYSTYLGGSGDEIIYGVAVDGAGNAYAAGATASAVFPLVNAFQSLAAGPTDGFLAKLSPGGNTLVYSTLLGGNGDDFLRAVAVDAAGSAYVTGYTDSSNFPVANPLQSSRADGVCPFQGVLVPCYDAVVTKFSPSGSQLVYSTYFGGNRDDLGNSIAVDGQGSAYIAGETESTNLPTANPLRAAAGGLSDGFVAKLSPNGGALAYSTYLAGQVNDFANAIAVNASGEAYVAGATESSDFPTLNSFQPLKGFNAFVLKMNAGGNALAFSTLLGGSGFGGIGGDEAYSVAADAGGSVYAAGTTVSSDFPTRNAFQGSFTPTACQIGNLIIACPEGFLAKLTVQSELFPGGVVNGASFAPNAAVAPGSIASAFGSDLVSAIAVAQQIPLPTLLASLSVRMNGILAPLYFVAGSQINLQIPWELAGQAQATVQVQSGGTVIPPITVNLASTAPGIFSVNAQGTGQGAILISNSAVFAAPAGSIPGAASRPANRGEFVTIYCTGLGPVSNQPPSGAAAPGGPNLAAVLTTPVVTLGGVPASVSFAGLSPGFVGLYQIDVQVPANAPTGSAVAVAVSVGGISSNTVQMAIQ